MYGNVRGAIRVGSDREVDHDLLSARMRAVLRHLRMGVDHDPIDMLEAICEQRECEQLPAAMNASTVNVSRVIGSWRSLPLGEIASTCTCTRARARMHARIHACMQTSIRTHVYTYTHIYDTYAKRALCFTTHPWMLKFSHLLPPSVGVDINETEPNGTRIARCIMRKNGINVGCQATPEEIFDILPVTTPMHNDGALSSPDDDSNTDTDYNLEEEDAEDAEEKQEHDLDLSLISSALTPRTGSNEHSRAGSTTRGGRRKASINASQHQPFGSPKSKRTLFGSPFGPSTPRKMMLSRSNSNSSPQGQTSPSSMHSLSKAASTPPRFSTSAFFWGSSAKAIDVACLDGESVYER